MLIPLHLASFVINLPWLPILPVPPFQEFRIVSAMACKVSRTAEDVQDAAIDVATAQLTKRLVQFLGVLPCQILDALQAQVAEILADTRTHAWNRLEVTRW